MEQTLEMLIRSCACSLDCQKAVNRDIRWFPEQLQFHHFRDRQCVFVWIFYYFIIIFLPKLPSYTRHIPVRLLYLEFTSQGSLFIPVSLQRYRLPARTFKPLACHGVHWWRTCLYIHSLKPPKYTLYFHFDNMFCLCTSSSFLSIKQDK